MRVRFYFLIIFGFLFFNSYAHSGDSIHSSALFRELEECSPDSIEKLIQILGKLENKITHFFSAEDATNQYREIAMIFYQKSLYTYAELYFQKSYEVNLKLGNSKEIARSLSNIAVMLELNGNYEDAISKYFEVLNMMRTLGDNEGIGKVLNNIGLTYEEMGQRHKALEYLQQAAKQKINNNDKAGLASTYNNIGVIFEEVLPYTDSALLYYKKAYNLYSELNMIMEFAQVKNNMALVYLKQKDYNKAYLFSIEALQIYDSLQSKRGIAITSRNLASINLELGNISLAYEHLEKSLQLCNRIGDVEIRLDLYHLFQKLYILKGEADNAIYYFNKYNNLKDSLINEKVQLSVAESEAKYKLKEHRFAIEELNLQNQLYKRKIKIRQILISLLIIILLSSAATMYMAIKNFKLREKQMRLEVQNYLETIRQLQQENTPNKQNIPNIGAFNLTEQEEKVLMLIANGKTNAEIAEELFVSVNTVKFHVKNIYVKLDVKNRVQAINLIDNNKN
jgi:DNA-binding CsgD family transcriptional regulator